ncbi:hypothetical protein D3C78_926760 [compost metagenome]
MVGVLGDHRAQAPVVQELLFLGAQVQDDVGAAAFFGHVSHREGAFPFGFPLYALARLCAGGAGDDGHLVGDDEGGVEAHPELTDQLGVLALIT